MLTNYEGFKDLILDKSSFEVPLGWWNKNKDDYIASVSLADNGSIAIGGECEVSKYEFLRGLIFSILASYSKKEVDITFLGLDNTQFEDFNIMDNVTITSNESDIKLCINELSLEVEKRLHLLDRFNLTFNEYNTLSPSKLPVKIIVLPNVAELKKSEFISNLGYKLMHEENRFRGNLTDRVYVLDCMTNAYRAGIYFVSIVGKESYTYLKSQNMNTLGISELIKGIKIGFNWDLIGLNTTYSMIGKGVVDCKGEEPYNFYSHTITRVDLLNNLKNIKYRG